MAIFGLGSQVEQIQEAIKVYNLEIEDSHTYYVSDREVLVHNDCNYNPDEIKKDSSSHIFSQKHKKDGIMDLGETEDDIMNAALDIINEVDAKKNLKDGPLQIRTYINNLKAEIRIFIKDGELINFDLFKGWSNEIKKNSIEWY